MFGVDLITFQATVVLRSLTWSCKIQNLINWWDNLNYGFMLAIFWLIFVLSCMNLSMGFKWCEIWLFSKESYFWNFENGHSLLSLYLIKSIMKTESNKNSISHRVWFEHEEANIDNNKICLPIDFILLKLFFAGLKYQKISSLKIIPQFPSWKFYNLLRYLQISTIKGVDCGHAFSMCTV